MVVRIKENVLPVEVCQYLIEVFDTNSGKIVYGHDHVIYLDNTHPIFFPLVQKIMKEMDLGEDFYPETMLLSKFHTGGFMTMHADNCKQDEQGDWIPNHTPLRQVSVVVFLNDDFEGGELSFPQHGLDIKPKTGMMVYYPSNINYLHEVKPVISGNRYKVAIWFGKK